MSVLPKAKPLCWSIYARGCSAKPRMAKQAHEAEMLGISAGAMKVTVHRMRQRFRRLVKAEIASTLNDEAVVEEEMQTLLVALGG
jgi:hypothetical protein